jgi:3-dehydroquinate dehydratase-2
MKILVINGPNLNMLGARDTSYYGKETLASICTELQSTFADIEFEFYQSNIEGEIVNKIQSASTIFDALIINPAAYSHTSIAIRDALEICSIIKIEVHLSNIANREDFRNRSITASKTDGYLSGFKKESYFAAVYLIKRILV